jgi:hypothetical protein
MHSSSHWQLVLVDDGVVEHHACLLNVGDLGEVPLPPTGDLPHLVALGEHRHVREPLRIMSAGVVFTAFSWCSPSHGRMIWLILLNQGFTCRSSTYSGSALPWPSPQSYRNSRPLIHWNAIQLVASEWIPDEPMSNATYTGWPGRG